MTSATVAALVVLPLFLAPFLAPGYEARVVRTSVSCTMMADPEECDFCVENKDRRLNECEKKARSRFSRTVHFRPSRYPEFTWTIDNSTFDESEELSITLFAWDATENANDPGYPIPGCCGVPVKEGKCRANICRKGHVFYRLVTNSCEYYAPRPVVPRHMYCSGDRDARKVARFLYLCPEKRTAWMSQLNCECVKYDTMTGDFMPTNDSQPWESLSYNVWLNLHRDSMSQRYSHLCMFTLPKAEVMREGKMSDSNSSKESFLFQRGVYDMPKRHWVNGSVLGLDGGSRVKCDAWKYNGSSVFELTSSTPDNDTFTCLVMWPNGTDQLRPFASHVKCMPPNATYVPFDSKSVFDEEKSRNNAMARTLIAIVGGAGALVVLAVVFFFAWKCNKKLKVYLKKTKAIPEHMDPIVDKKSCVSATSTSNVVEREKADLLVYSTRENQEGFQRNNFSPRTPDMTSSDPRYDVFFNATSSSSPDDSKTSIGDYKLKLALDDHTFDPRFGHVTGDVTSGEPRHQGSLESAGSDATTTSLLTMDSDIDKRQITRSGSLSPDSGCSPRGITDPRGCSIPGKILCGGERCETSFCRPLSPLRAKISCPTERANFFHRPPLPDAQFHCSHDLRADSGSSVEEAEKDIVGYLSKTTLTPVVDEVA